mmetsp:Transcript_36992/g.73212  ORF Transcript_36992/g.73212 Transcript_36992/m.73212 type:complete len:313 (+) Transcript_36992:35-973(+)
MALQSKSFSTWHATDIAWPPVGDGVCSTSRSAMEDNRLWLQQRGVHVSDNVDAFDLLSYLSTIGLRAEDVVLCVFNCAHGRNYRSDSDERHASLKEWGWGHTTFRSAIFEAICGQLPAASCVLTGRHWEQVATQVSERRILRCFATYGAQSGVPFRPEPSTRGDRREGELGRVDDLVATVASGPLMDQHLLQGPWSTLDITELVLLADAAGGVILFLGEFTLASSRHCVQYVIDHAPVERSHPEGLGNVLNECRMKVPERRRHIRGGWYTYADCLQHAMVDKKERQPALVAANIWLAMCPAIPSLPAGGGSR